MTDPVFIVIYVDDILLFAMNLDTIVSLKNLFSERFECKDLGPLSRFLGVNVKYEPMSYVMLDQSHYAETFTQKFARQHEMIFSSHREVPLPYDTVERFFFTMKLHCCLLLPSTIGGLVSLIWKSLALYFIWR